MNRSHSSRDNLDSVSPGPRQYSSDSLKNGKEEKYKRGPENKIKKKERKRERERERNVCVCVCV